MSNKAMKTNQRMMSFMEVMAYLKDVQTCLEQQSCSEVLARALVVDHEQVIGDSYACECSANSAATAILRIERESFLALRGTGNR